MQSRHVESFEDWRNQARQLIAAEVSPREVCFRENSSQSELFGATNTPQEKLPPARPFRVDRKFIQLADRVVCHRDVDRYDLLYRILWRLTHGEPKLMQVTVDDDIYRASMMEKAVRRDAHKMKAFVRFCQVETESDREKYVAWHEPDHKVLRLIAPFFARRFRGMDWTILTPDESVSWDGKQFAWGPGVPMSQRPRADSLEELWKTYYASIFNPARLKTKAMKAEMPVRYWKTLPEAELIDDLIRKANTRTESMISHREGVAFTAERYLPEELTVESFQAGLAQCDACSLCEHATQVIAGEGPVPSRLVLVGEQPGDQEDLVGRPFVGPAGQILNQALQDAGIRRDEVYLTNAVKHFKFEERGKQRLHKRPNVSEVTACHPWLQAEFLLTVPSVVVCLGSTAAQAVLGRGFKIQTSRGQFFPGPHDSEAIATYHPSAALRVRDAKRKEEIIRHLTEDLHRAAEKAKA